MPSIYVKPGTKRMTEPKLWEWADSLVGMIMGVVMGILSVLNWISGRLGKIHERINSLDAISNSHAESIATLNAHHESNLQFHLRTDQALDNLNDKNDEQLRILGQLQGAINGKGRS